MSTKKSYTVVILYFIRRGNIYIPIYIYCYTWKINLIFRGNYSDWTTTTMKKLGLFGIPHSQKPRPREKRKIIKTLKMMRKNMS